MKFTFIVLLGLSLWMHFVFATNNAIASLDASNRPQVQHKRSTIYRSNTRHLRIQTAESSIPMPLSIESDQLEGCKDCDHGELEHKDDDHSEFNDFAYTVFRLSPSELRVYQSAKQQPITLQGTGFSSQMSLHLDPPLRINVDYTLEVTSVTTAVLALLPGKKWRVDPGFIIMRGINNGGVRYPLGDEGVLIATVMADPVPSPDTPSAGEPQQLITTNTNSTKPDDRLPTPLEVLKPLLTQRTSAGGDATVRSEGRPASIPWQDLPLPPASAAVLVCVAVALAYVLKLFRNRKPLSARFVSLLQAESYVV